jgi:Iap family predicted aminopeptidase
MSFQVGDTVTWTSQAGGHSKTKVGEVVNIVPKGSQLSWRGVQFKDTHRFRHGGGPRNHESYLVSVPAKTSKGKPTLYWPVVKNLRKVEPPTAAESDHGQG